MIQRVPRAYLGPRACAVRESGSIPLLSRLVMRVAGGLWLAVPDAGDG